ncbi:MAG: PHP domain-containing protein, partial [Herpetosiphon sp.]|nr:PHP domain-containing protein [Herpetosiphon sp.]
MTQIDEVKGTSNGRWMRLDLHIHTPASEDYAETSVSFLEILQEAERHHLDVIAFTDHNTVHGYGQFRDEIDFLHRLVTANRCTDDERERYNEYQRLLEKMTVLPGFEFTSHYGAHILGIFAPETPLSILEAV